MKDDERLEVARKGLRETLYVHLSEPQKYLCRFAIVTAVWVLFWLAIGWQRA